MTRGDTDSECHHSSEFRTLAEEVRGEGNDDDDTTEAASRRTLVAERAELLEARGHKRRGALAALRWSRRQLLLLLLQTSHTHPITWGPRTGTGTGVLQITAVYW